MQIENIEETVTLVPSKKLISLEQRIDEACLKVAPLWSLENFIAVNPYMSNAGKGFASTVQELAYIADIDSTMSAKYYLDKIKNNEILAQDIEKALKSSSESLTTDSGIFIKSLEVNYPKNSKVPTIGTAIEIASQIIDKDWQRFALQRISLWCASYFDKGQAQLSFTINENPFLSWKEEALIDRTPEIAGLLGFKNNLKNIPNHPLEAIKYNLSILGLKDTAASFYLQRLLMSLNGWAGYAAKLDYEAKLENKKSNVVLEILAVLTSWELCTFLTLKNETLIERWNETISNFEKIEEGKIYDHKIQEKIILQEALNFSIQRKVIEKINTAKTSNEITHAEIQAIFCIDVRSEVYRRNLEQTNPQIQTLGFAGFFGFPVNFYPLGKQNRKIQSPALLIPKLKIVERIKDKTKNNKIIKQLHLKDDISSLWKTFKSGSVSCFVFVSPLGLLYIPKLILETFKLSNGAKGYSFLNKRKKARTTIVSLKSNNELGIPIETQVEMAKNALTAMSLTENFGKYVMLVGHGSSTKNNPYGSALHCGACGGHTGEANVKIAAAVFNNSYVRTKLKDFNINIPEDTVFLACLHNTTTDEISIFNEDDSKPGNEKLLASLKSNLVSATEKTLTERALRMTTKNNKNVIERSKDWSQIRPEWGLAGCNAFLVSKSHRTKNLNLKGEVFLHTYDSEKDTENNVLQAIMTAPMVVTSWISLQYYASTVDNKKLGSGNKTLHNITAGIGVIEGFSGDLRTGLPWQSVSDGNQLQHTPTILNVIIEASMEALNEVIEKNQSVRDLVDNGWLKLLHMNNEGVISNRYIGNLKWETI